MPYTVEQRGRSTVGYMRGFTHHNYEDRFRLLSLDVPIVADAGRGEMFAVFDGMGGLRQGMHAAQHMADLLIEYFEFPDRHEGNTLGVQQLLLRGSREIKDWGRDPDSANPLGGCVGTIVWVHEAKARVYHLGDTECWVSHWPGHSEKITDSQAIGGRVTQFFGMRAEPVLQVLTLGFTKDMRLTLTSDGPRNARIVSALARILAERQTPRMAVSEVCGAAVASRAPDNITILMITGDKTPSVTRGFTP